MIRTRSRKDLPIQKRDAEGLHSLDRTKFVILERNILITRMLLIRYNKISFLRNKLIRLHKILHVAVLDVLYAPLERKSKKKRHPRVTISSFESNDEKTEFSTLFRFQSGMQLRKLLIHFRFPAGLIKVRTYRFTSEEILILGLIR